MKVTLDLDKLLEDGEIDQAEYEKLSRLSAGGTTALAFNILVGFGVIAVSGASLALLPNATTAVVLGLAIGGAGVGLVYAQSEQWRVLANICVLVGALLFGGGVIYLGKGAISSLLTVAAVLAVAGVLARSGLLVVLSVLVLSSCLGARTHYLEATYYLGMEEPTASVVLFTLLGIAIYQLSKRLPADYESLAIAAARTCVFLVNLAFWIGSLWGDQVEWLELTLADGVFSAVWAIALVITGVWGWRRNRRWVVNVIAVFGAIHFYTQWFERLGATAETVLLAGLIALGIAVGLRAVNNALREAPAAPQAGGHPPA